jgi:multidrug transporter EmrE-like cation transporter
MFTWRTIAFGILFGLLDSIALPVVKGVSIGWDPAWMTIPIALYATSPIIFLKALEKETLTIMNLVWDLTSDLVVTVIGLFVFAEKITPLKMLGVCLSFVSLFLMSYDGDGWNDYISNNWQRLTGGSNQGSAK